MKIQVYKPDRDLQSFLKSYCLIEINNCYSSYSVQFLLPEAFFNIYYLISGKIDGFSADDYSCSFLPGDLFAGIFDKYYSLNVLNQCKFLRIQFYPGKCKILFNDTFIFPHNQLILLGQQQPAIQSFFRRQQLNLNDSELPIESLNQYFLRLLIRNEKNLDQKIDLAVKRIEDSKGLIRIQQLASDLNISISHFRKRFKAAVRTTPKRYARIQRIKHITRRIHSDRLESMTSLAYDFKYFDQSHFIRDVQGVCGVSPRQLNSEYFTLSKKLELSSEY